MTSGLTIRTEQVAPVPGRIRGVSAGVRWDALQPLAWWDFRADILQPLDAIIDLLAARGGWMIFRVICGTSAPAWVTGSDREAANGYPVAPITLQFRDSHGHVSQVVAPLPFDSMLPFHYETLMLEVSRWARGRTPAGTVRASVIAFVPVAMPTVEGTEMTLTTQGLAFNEAAWNAAEPDAGKRQGRLLIAWQDGMTIHHDVFDGLLRSAVALGPMMGDRMSGASHLLDAGDWHGIYPMVTNLRVGSDGKTYRSWSASWADLLAHAATVGTTVCQTSGRTDSGGQSGLQPGQLPAAVHDAAHTYRCQIVETYSAAIAAQSPAQLAAMEAELAAVV